MLSQNEIFNSYTEALEAIVKASDSRKERFAFETAAYTIGSVLELNTNRIVRDIRKAKRQNDRVIKNKNIEEIMS